MLPFMGDETMTLPAPQAARSEPDNTVGLLALVLGAVSFVAGGLLLGIPAIVLGVKGRRRADAGLATNRDQATAGLVCGIISTAMSAVGSLVVLALVLFLMPWPYGGSATASASTGGSAKVVYRASTPSAFDVQQQAMRFLSDTGRSVASIQCQPLLDLLPGSNTTCDGVLVGGQPVNLQVQVAAPDGELQFLG